MFDALFPIECKRLPTPKRNNRDEREYVFTAPGTTGGIQRYKFGHHGAAHNFAAMIAYVQEQTISHWLIQVNGWIRGLAADANSNWSDSDVLQDADHQSSTETRTLRSNHPRIGGFGDIEIHHLWIRM